MDGEFPEQFKCPICFEVPEKEIYQCENGHTICDSCVNGLLLCPQCRVDLNAKKIRNRGLEDILDMLKFNCSFKYPIHLVGVVEKLGENRIQEIIQQRKEKDTHCTGCLCKNPILLQILRDKMLRTKESTTKFPEALDVPKNQTLIINSSDYLKSYQIYEYEDIDEGTYSKEFLQNCRDPQFLKDQLEKVEKNYESKMSEIQERRKEELIKHERHYTAIKDEILKDEWFQI